MGGSKLTARKEKEMLYLAIRIKERAPNTPALGVTCKEIVQFCNRRRFDQLNVVIKEKQMIGCEIGTVGNCLIVETRVVEGEIIPKVPKHDRRSTALDKTNRAGPGRLFNRTVVNQGDHELNTAQFLRKKRFKCELREGPVISVRNDHENTPAGCR